MSSELSKKAVDMLLKGATLVSQPCPYCKGVRIIKDGYAFCVSCGKEPEIKETESELLESNSQKSKTILNVLEQKLEKISKELELEQDYEKQQQILKSINSLVEIIGKLKK